MNTIAVLQCALCNVTVTSCNVYVGVSAMEIKTEPNDVIEYRFAHHGISAELQPAAHHLS